MLGAVTLATVAGGGVHRASLESRTATPARNACRWSSHWARRDVTVSAFGRRSGELGAKYSEISG